MLSLQLEHGLPKGMAALTKRVPRQGRALGLPRAPAAPNQKCEATGKQLATCWRLTFPATPAILRGVGCAVGGSTLLGGSGAGRTTPDYPTMFMALLMALS